MRYEKDEFFYYGEFGDTIEDFWGLRKHLIPRRFYVVKLNEEVKISGQFETFDDASFNAYQASKEGDVGVFDSNGRKIPLMSQEAHKSADLGG